MFSKRIKKIASLVDHNYIIDIGCDHALLDIYLTLNCNCRCIASDINKNALENAKRNVNKYKLNDKIEIVLSDGFQNINLDKIYQVIITGMGTSTIKKITSECSFENINSFIIQTNNDYEGIRIHLNKLGYYIEDEIAFVDRKIEYIIIKFKKGYKKYSKIDYYLGPILKTKNDDDTKNYYKNLYNKNKKIIKKMSGRNILKKVDLYIKNIWIKKLI